MVDRTRTRRELCAYVGAALSLSACFNPQASDTSTTDSTGVTGDTTATASTADPTGDPTSEPTGPGPGPGSDTTPPPTTTTEPTTGSECDCPDTAPICHEELEICVECMTATDCTPGQICHPDLHTCEQCVLGSDCKDPAAPACDAVAHECRRCEEHSECGEANACDIFTGHCFPPASMTTHVYVDDDPGICMEGGDCSSAVPCCEISQALDPTIVDKAPHTIVHVAPGAYGNPVGIVAAVDKRVAILAEPDAVLDTMAVGTPLALGGTSALFVAGLTISASTTQNTSGVDCLDNTGGLWFDDGAIVGYGVAGVVANACVATVRRTRILRNGYGVLAGTGGKIFVRNTMIAGFHAAIAAATLSDGKIDLLYTTLVDRNNAVENHLLTCDPPGTVTIRNSILYDLKPGPLSLMCNPTIETTAYRTGAFTSDGDPTLPTDMPNAIFVDFYNDDVDLMHTTITEPFLGVARWQMKDPQTDIYGVPRPNVPDSMDVPGANIPAR